MLLGKVVGTVVATQKESSLDGLRFMIVLAIDDGGEPTGATVVAADAVGAGVGEIVMYASGSSARQMRVTDKRPVDAMIMAIVDQWEVGGDTRYKKGRDD